MQTVARPRAVVDRPDARPLAAPRGALAFEGVRFHYGRGGGVFENLTLRIAPGEKVGLVGRSGAGKSTLVNLLLRFHDVEAGRILIDGQDIPHATQDSLRQQIGMVTQDTSLLHRSILDNIRYGRPEASLDEVVAAAKKAHAHEFVTGLVDPDGRRGYDVHVGERGVKLSGGQRQRVAIARVLLEERADPGARRGDLGARFRDRGGNPGKPRRADERQDRHRHRAPALHHRRDGPAGGARKRRDRRNGLAPRAASRARGFMQGCGDGSRAGSSRRERGSALDRHFGFGDNPAVARGRLWIARNGWRLWGWRNTPRRSSAMTSTWTCCARSATRT